MRLAQYDAVVIGAGPYGLSVAAHLLGRGLATGVFGKPMELWRRHMPPGMLLRSHWWATSLSDPHQEHGLDRYLEESGRRACYPVPREAFIDYGLWFQERAVPDVDPTYVESVEQRDGRFFLRLADGRSLTSAAVVMASGLAGYARRPAELPHSSGLVSHTSEIGDLRRFGGQQVLVVGGGQSAIEYAALLHEAGASVHVVARRPILWLAPDLSDQRTRLERILAPNARIAPGWINWTLDHAPYLFHRLPRHLKDRAMRTYFTTAASDWLRERVVGKVALHEGQSLAGLAAGAGQVEARLSGGQRLTADHVILATGYEVDIRRLKILQPSLLARIGTDGGSPVLSRSFESSVAGLYFVGLTSLRAFGPLYRFVAGCPATARGVAASVARKVRRTAVPGFGLVPGASRARYPVG